jgi:DNA repair exonuclease SbcCD ATPase subunit
MIIKRIMVKRFRAIQALKNPLEFFPGLNIVKGSDNEAGKSSLRMAITSTLFQDPNMELEDLQSLTTWGADEPWKVTLEFEAEGESYVLTRDFKDNTSELISTGPHEFIARNKESIAEKIAELTGCPTRAFFESTACIGQEEFIRIVPQNARNSLSNPVSTMTKRLQTKLSGMGGTDIPVLLASLYAKTRNKDAAGPYFHLLSINEHIADLRGQRLEQELKLKGILEKRSLSARTRLNLKQINHELTAKQDLLNKNNQALTLQDDITREKARYDIFQNANRLKAEITRLDEELQSISHFAGAEEKNKKLEDTRNGINQLTRQLVSAKDGLKELDRQKPAFWIMVAGAVLIIGGLAGLLANHYLWTISVVGVLFAAYWLINYRLWQKQRGLADQKLEELGKDIRDFAAEEQQIYQEFQSEGYEVFQKNLTDYRLLTNSKRDAQKGLEILTEGKDWQKFSQENLDMDLKVSAELKELQQLEPFKLDPNRLQQLRSEVENLQAQKENLERELGALEKFFQYTCTDRDQIIDIEEELAELEQKRKSSEKTRKVYEATREILEQAYRQTLSRAADLMEAEISRWMTLITEGRYSRVKMAEKDDDLSIQTFSPEMNDWVSVDALSRATQDQFYICARLALAKLITEGKKPVILLDDPFVNFHARRLKKMLSVLQDFTREGYQILLFTTSDAYDYLGKVVTIE